jgi:hypothetical protein
MANQEDIDSALEELRKQWNKAENAIKIAEQVNGKIVNPAIYELRYSGRRIVEALAAQKHDKNAAKKLIDDAIFDCCRARHDAIDAATSKIAADLKIATKRLGAKNILQNFPQYSELASMIDGIRSRIAVSRENREDRDAIYESIEAADLPAVVKVYNRFTSSEPLMIQAARSDRLFIGISLTIGAIGAIASIIALF